MVLRINIYAFIFLTAILGYPCQLYAQAKNPVIAFTSDTQAPLLIEHIIRKLDRNEQATEMIFKDILTLHPAALFILGDVVSLGYKDAKWKKIDQYLKQYATDSIPVYAAYGNHELMLNAAKGKRNFQSRFPMHSPMGYYEVIDSVAVVLLNSNFGKMTTDEIAKQDTWYNNTLQQLNADAAVKLIIVGCHHSPYTNSTAVKPSALVQQKFVPAFISSKKCVLFLSGHSHNFEQFKVQGKYFMVIGGGGGPHQPLYKNKELTHDLAHDYKPPYHYLTIKRTRDTLQIISRQLKTDFTGFTDGLKLTVSP